MLATCSTVTLERSQEQRANSCPPDGRKDQSPCCSGSVPLPGVETLIAFSLISHFDLFDRASCNESSLFQESNSLTPTDVSSVYFSQKFQLYASVFSSFSKATKRPKTEACFGFSMEIQNSVLLEGWAQRTEGQLDTYFSYP